MELEEGQDQTPDVEQPTEEVGNSQEQETPVSEDRINPVWEPIRQELGLSFETIKPHLLEIDKGFNQGITKANERYAPWKAFDEQGITPEAINQSFAVLQRLNDSPEEVYAALGQFLQENGRLPQNQQEAEEALDNAGEEEMYETPEQQKIAELEARLSEFQQFQQAQFEQQQMAELEARADQEVSQEYEAFEKAHPELTPLEKQEIYKQHYLYAASGPQNMKSLEQVFAEFSEFKGKILATPRPNDLAPRLPGAGGGVPTGQHKDPSQFSREESQDALAALIAQANNS